MKKILIHITDKSKNYPIIVEQQVIEELSTLIDINKYSKIVIITDENIPKLFLDNLLKLFSIKPNTIILPAGENHKNIDSVQNIWKHLHAFGCDRKSLVINLGGGVVGDMGGFAASTYMRGIDFLQIPTTLLAAVDASVGGKTAIDFADVKNLIGAFQQPIGVIIDVNFLETLPERELLNGFAEVIKHGLVQDRKYFEFVTSKKPTEFTKDEMIEIIAGSCEIKAKIVENDASETGPRKLLNFGHTIGHAIEALSWETKNPLMHGEAVHIGILAETKISNLAGLLSDEEAKLVEQTLQETGLPISINNIDADNIMSNILFDKKNVNGIVKWVLLKQLGEAVYDQEVDNSIVTQALEEIIQ